MRLVLVLLLFSAASCGGSDDVDGGGVLACRDLQDAAEDYVDGVLTEVELRERLADIEENASMSDDPVIASSARSALAAATSGDVAGLTTAIETMSTACFG